MEDFEKTEEKLESRLLVMYVACKEEEYNPLKGKTFLQVVFGEVESFPYGVEMRLPSGKILKTDFAAKTEQPSNFPYDWYQEGNQKATWLLIPEVENILEKIQIRIVPASQRISQLINSS